MKRILMIMTALFLIRTPVYAEMETETANFELFTMNVPSTWEREDNDLGIYYWCVYSNPDSEIENLSVMYQIDPDFEHWQTTEETLNSFKDEKMEAGDEISIRTFKDVGVETFNGIDFCHANQCFVIAENNQETYRNNSYDLVFSDPDFHTITISVSYDPDQDNTELFEYTQQMHESIELK